MEILNNITTNPVTVSIDLTAKSVFDKNDIKAKRILLDAIKDHVIPHVSGKDYAH